jgi:hypothetical protein
MASASIHHHRGFGLSRGGEMWALAVEEGRKQNEENLAGLCENLDALAAENERLERAASSPLRLSKENIALLTLARYVLNSELHLRIETLCLSSFPLCEPLAKRLLGNTNSGNCVDNSIWEASQSVLHTNAVT